MFVVLATFPGKALAEKIAKMLLDKQLAGCVQVLGPVKSTFLWKGKKETAKEYLCLITTLKPKFKSLEKLIRHHHPCEAPQIIALGVTRASASHYRRIQSVLKI